MQKLHMRLSVEIEVTDDQFREIVDGGVGDVEFDELPHPIQDKLNAKQFDLCDWDDGGYIPGPWLAEDVKYSGLYRKEV